MITTLDDLDNPDLRTTVVIVGAGPAGITVAQELSAAAFDVILLESGREAPDTSTGDLDEIETIGMRRAPQSETRARGLGGTSSLWSGRCAVFDEIDFEARPWVPHSGWPITSATLEPYLPRAGALLGLGPTRFRSPSAPLPDAVRAAPWDPARLHPLVFQASLDHTGSTEPRRDQTPDLVEGGENLGALQHPGAPEPVRFGPAYIPRLARHPNVRILTDATVVGIDLGNGDRARAVVARSSAGRKVRVDADVVVIAAGGLESARILLAAASADRPAPGNRYDLVGRFLMDHPFAPVGVLPGRGDSTLRRRFGQQWLDRHGVRHVSSTGVRLSPNLQRVERLLNAQIHTVDRGDLRSPLRRARDTVRGFRDDDGDSSRFSSAARLGFDAPRLAGGLYDRFVRHRPSLSVCDEVVFGCVVEQVPDPESRLVLSPRTRDRHGIPRARLDWRSSDAEFDTLRRTVAVLHDELHRLGHPVPDTPTWLDEGAEGWRSTVHDMAHPLGTTRMSASPRRGVVDANCRVHDIDGLFVIGSSVFTTSGTINPTLTIVALALRLADHLRGRLIASPRVTTPRTLRASTVSQSPGPTSDSVRNPLRVGIVGLGSRAAEAHLPVLRALADDFSVVGFTSRDPQRRALRSRTYGIDGFEATSDLVASARPDVLLLASPPTAVEATAWDALSTGLPILAETPLAWGVPAGRKLVEAAAKRPMPFAIAEQTPFLPEEQLKQSMAADGHLGKIDLIDNDFAIYDYHGIAAMRRYLPVGVVPESVSATSAPVNGLPVVFGVIRCNDGTILRQQYLSTETTPVGSASLRIVGRQAQFLGKRFCRSDGRSATIERIERGDRLEALELRDDATTIRWVNPFGDHPFSDEQIAVAALWTAFAAAAATPMSDPAYSAADALVDVEILTAMRLSALRHGHSVSVPLTPLPLALLGASRLTGAVRSRIPGQLRR